MIRTIRYTLALMLLAIAAPFAWLASVVTPKVPQQDPSEQTLPRQAVPRHIRRQRARRLYKVATRVGAGR